MTPWCLLFATIAGTWFTLHAYVPHQRTRALILEAVDPLLAHSDSLRLAATESVDEHAVGATAAQ